ncbi:MAG: hypothetical protein HY860_02130 [Chlamydiales bacterium]|nr:hypothetical protein [Chlamydiales bacterium]
MTSIVSLPSSPLDPYTQTMELRAEEVAPFIFRELDALNCHSVFSFISSREIDSLRSEPLEKYYERCGPRAVKYFETLDRLEHFRALIPKLREVKGYPDHRSVESVSTVHLGCGECQEQSTYAACRIASIFRGHILQLGVYHQHDRLNNHGFCLISNSDKDSKYFKALTRSKDREFSLEELAARAPDALVIDPWIRTTCEARSIKDCERIQRLFADNGYNYLMDAVTVDYDPGRYLSVMGLVRKVMENEKVKKGPELSHQLIVITALDERRKNSTIQTHLTTNFPGVEWKINTAHRKFFVRGAKEMLDPIHEQLSLRSIGSTYSKVKDSADYVIIISYEEAGKLLKDV